MYLLRADDGRVVVHGNPFQRQANLRAGDSRYPGRRRVGSGEGGDSCHAWPKPWNYTLLYHAGTEHVGFAPTRQTVLACAIKREAPWGVSASRMKGGPHRIKNRSRGGLAMDDIVEGTNLFSGVRVCGVCVHMIMRGRSRMTIAWGGGVYGLA